LFGAPSSHAHCAADHCPYVRPNTRANGGTTGGGAPADALGTNTMPDNNSTLAKTTLARIERDEGERR
jgi:hypothetical protein